MCQAKELWVVGARKHSTFFKVLRKPRCPPPPIVEDDLGKRAWEGRRPTAPPEVIDNSVNYGCTKTLVSVCTTSVCLRQEALRHQKVCSDLMWRTCVVSSPSQSRVVVGW